jgi:hypothetical protein
LYGLLYGNHILQYIFFFFFFFFCYNIALLKIQILLFAAIGGATGELLEQNAQALNQITANLSTLQVKNLHHVVIDLHYPNYYTSFESISKVKINATNFSLFIDVN